MHRNLRLRQLHHTHTLLDSSRPGWHATLGGAPGFTGSTSLCPSRPLHSCLCFCGSDPICSLHSSRAPKGLQGPVATRAFAPPAHASSDSWTQPPPQAASGPETTPWVPRSPPLGAPGINQSQPRVCSRTTQGRALLRARTQRTVKNSSADQPRRLDEPTEEVPYAAFPHGGPGRSEPGPGSCFKGRGSNRLELTFVRVCARAHSPLGDRESLRSWEGFEKPFYFFTFTKKSRARMRKRPVLNLCHNSKFGATTT